MRVCRLVWAMAVVLGATAGLAQMPASCGHTTAPIASPRGPGWAIFSPEDAIKLKSVADSPAGRSAVKTAAEFVSAMPHPMARVHTEGTLQHQGIRDESQVGQKDWEGMLSLALAYRLTGEAKYLAATDCYLGAWTAVYKPSLNPIDETRMDALMMAYDLTTGSLSATTEKQAQVLWEAMAREYIEWMEHNGQKDAANWSSHRVKLGVMAAYETGDTKLEARGAAVFREHLALNMRTDGSVVDFYKRDALHYVAYDLEPLEMAVLTAKMHGAEWFHASVDGKSVAAGVDWLIPYAVGEKKHDEFIHSTVSFDAARDKAGEKGYSGPWDPSAGVQTLMLAAILDPDYNAALLQNVKLTGKSPVPWTRLFQAMHDGAGAK